MARMMEAMSLSSFTITMKANHTEPDRLAQTSGKRFFLEMVAALSIPISFWGMIGNATVFWLLCRKVKKTTFTVYFLNLIVADFIVAAYFFIVFCVFLTSFSVSYYFSRTMENIYSVSNNASTFLLTVICLERYAMVSFPLYYHAHRPKDFTVNMCCVVWFWSSVLALLLYVACYQVFLSVFSQNGYFCHGAVIFETIIHVTFLFPIMSFSALSLFIRRRKRAKQMTESRLDITIIIMVVIFFVCIFTFQFLNFISKWVMVLRAPSVFHLSLLFNTIKSSTNPFVYFFVGKWQRENAAEPMYKLFERALYGNESRDAPDTS